MAYSITAQKFLAELEKRIGGKPLRSQQYPQNQLLNAMNCSKLSQRITKSSQAFDKLSNLKSKVKKKDFFLTDNH